MTHIIQRLKRIIIVTINIIEELAALLAILTVVIFMVPVITYVSVRTVVDIVKHRQINK